MKTLLNIGGGSSKIELPERYKDYEVKLMDAVKYFDSDPDYLCDIRFVIVEGLPKFDAVYCSHMLEHLNLHEVSGVLKKMYDILKPGGTAEIAVPDLRATCEQYLRRSSLVIPLYTTQQGLSISTMDVLYGYQQEVKKGMHYMQHKCGFDREVLYTLVTYAGFDIIKDYNNPKLFELRIVAEKKIED